MKTPEQQQYVLAEFEELRITGHSNPGRAESTYREGGAQAWEAAAAELESLGLDQEVVLDILRRWRGNAAELRATELAARSKIVKCGAYEICAPENLDERQLRAGASIGLMRFRDKIIAQHTACRKAADEATGSEIRRLEERCKTLLDIITQCVTEDRYT